MDRGGDIAVNLDRFYNQVRSRLLQAQIQASAAILEEQMNLLLSLRETWQEVERRTLETKFPTSGIPTASPAATSTMAAAAPGNWRA